MRDRDAFWTSYPVGDLTTKLTQEAIKSGIDAPVANAAVPAAVQANRPKPGWSAAKATELKDKLQESIKEKVGSHPLFKHEGDRRTEVLEQLGLDLEHYLTERPGLRRDSTNLVKRWAAAIATVLVMLGVLGWRSKRTLAGVLVGSRNRLSLSRLQLYIWTTLVLSMFLVTAAFLIGVAPRAALLPVYPAEIWALLGIVIATPVASGLILKPKQEQQPSAAALTESAVEHHRGVLETRTSSDRWSFLDLFTGEEVANAGEVDVSRFQSFIITVILVTIFVGWCAQIFWNIEPQAALQWAKWAKSGCYPPLDTTFVGLLAVSHGSYLAAAKAMQRAETWGKNPRGRRGYRDIGSRTDLRLAPRAAPLQPCLRLVRETSPLRQSLSVSRRVILTASSALVMPIWAGPARRPRGRGVGERRGQRLRLRRHLLVDQAVDRVVDLDRLERADPALVAGLAALGAAAAPRRCGACIHPASNAPPAPARLAPGRPGKSRRTSRWAITARSVEASKKGSIFMSRIRVIAPTASLVWTVERTRWPVSDAWTAMSAVSRSRISPTMTTSGSWRGLPEGGREAETDLGVDLGLANSVDRIFDGVLDREDVAGAVVEQSQACIEAGRLARSGRPGDEDDPVRLLRAHRGRERGPGPAFQGRRDRSRHCPCRGSEERPARRPGSAASTRGRRAICRPGSARSGRPGEPAARQCRSLAMTLIRLTTTGATWGGIRSVSRSTPSMRIRTTRPLS